MGSSTGTLLIPDDHLLREVLASGTRRAAVHAEDEERLNARLPIRNSGGGPELHPQWRDVKTALLATERLIKLARICERPVHVLHITTCDEIALLRNAGDIAVLCSVVFVGRHNARQYPQSRRVKKLRRTRHAAIN